MTLKRFGSAALAAAMVSSACATSSPADGAMSREEHATAQRKAAVSTYGVDAPRAPPAPVMKDNAVAKAEAKPMEMAAEEKEYIRASRVPATTGVAPSGTTNAYPVTPPPPPRELKKADASSIRAMPKPSVPMSGMATGDRETDEGYVNYGVNAFTLTSEDRLSTFAVDVDTASYTLARRKIIEGNRPHPDSVRVEEFVNYFKYDYAAPKDGPLTVHMDAAPSPFQKNRTFLRVGVQGKQLSLRERKPAHLTFLVDVSGSMSSPDRLPLAKKALRMLVDNLRDGDTVALVTYAGGVRDVLSPTGMEHKAKIHEAIEELTAGGSTAMASGIELAYKHAASKLTADSNSRVIILSDGDANVGPRRHEDILHMISKYVKEGVTLSAVGFGVGNYKDDLMEQLANKGNGNYFYCDSLLQAKRIFQEQLGGTLEVIAKDVKLQVEFDPALVKSYRLVGYENRNIADQDFRNDKVDAGEIGSGHTVTAMYELELNEGAASKSFATVRVRAKPPRGETAAESVYAFKPGNFAPKFEAASKDLRFAVAVAGTADIFRNSPWAKEWSLSKMQQIAREAADGSPERLEFVSLLDRANGVYAVATR